MRVLITGGAGFIGSHLADAYLARGDEVYVLDDLSTGSMKNLLHNKPNPHFHYQIDSVHNRSAVAELVDLCDVVYHLAAAVGVRLIIDSPVRTIVTNVHGTEVLLEEASKKSKKILLASTSEVYGLSPHVPFREDGVLVLGSTDKGRWSYACSKAVDEFLALAYWRERHLPATIVRLFNTVGPRQTGQYGMVLPTFVRQALEEKPLTVFGDGQQARCFCYVGDVVAALVKLMDQPGVAGQIYNIGSTEEISIRGLAERIKILTGSASPIVAVPYDQAYEVGFEDMPRRVPDIAKIHAKIGFQPTTNLDAIIESVIAHERTAS
jgi:UDP-glucose 4-epimerase